MPTSQTPTVRTYDQIVVTQLQVTSPGTVKVNETRPGAPMALAATLVRCAVRADGTLEESPFAADRFEAQIDDLWGAIGGGDTALQSLVGSVLAYLIARAAAQGWT